MACGPPRATVHKQIQNISAVLRLNEVRPHFRDHTKVSETVPERG